MASGKATDRLATWERVGLYYLAAVVIIFGAVTELRSAFLHRRMGDAGVFFRAAWAVRSGADIYDVTDDNHWHFNYPPLFAILMTPLADAPPNESQAGLLPFGASIGIWYTFNIACLIFAVHMLASALEASSTRPDVRGQPAYCRRWWYLRVLPILVCLPPVGLSLMRGQVNMVLLLLLAGLAASAMRGRSGSAGLWLAGAICLKVIPAFLLLFPLWRRDRRCLIFCGFGLFAGLVAIPLLALGPTRAVSSYQSFFEGVLAPGLGLSMHPTRARELLDVTATASQSFQATLHNTLHPHRWYRPNHASDAVVWTGRLLGLSFTVFTLIAYGWRRKRDGLDSLVLLACLVLCMLFLSPICHLHYFTLSILLIMGLTLAEWEKRADLRLSLGLGLLLAINVVANALPNFDGFELFRDLGLAMYAGIWLWLSGVGLLWRRHSAEPATVSDRLLTQQAA
ncbi:MAG TPA: glycosyltransferase family 87 protein [Gemmataceae bacterium]|nr:glycosyltransferase family 87 protein [Gemmataceae bacterium]